MLPAPPRRTLPSQIALAMGLLLLAACGGGGDPTVPEQPAPEQPGTPQPTPAFTISAAAPASVTQGDSVTTTISITRSGGFAGAVTLIVDGTPNSVESRLATATIAAGSTTTTLTLVVARAVAPGSYPMTIRAEGSGVTAQTAAITLQVTLLQGKLTLTRRNAQNQLSTTLGGVPIEFDLTLQQLDAINEATISVVSTLPAGVTVDISPTTLVSGGSHVVLSASTAAVPGSYTLVLQAAATNSSTATLDVPFTVLGAAGIAMTFTPPALSVERNSTGESLLELTLTNFSGAYTLSTDGVPSGVVITYDYQRTNTYIARVTTDNTAPLGTFPITFTATAAGTPPASAVLTLTIAPAPVGGATTFRFCGSAAQRPIWFGLGRNGGTWSRVLPDAQGNFVFDVGTKTDVAWVVQNGADDFAVTVMTGTEGELTAFGNWPCMNLPTRTIAGAVANLLAGDTATVAVGPFASTTPITLGTPAYSFQSIDGDALDVLAVRRRAVSGIGVIDRMLIRRGGAPSGGAIASIDLAGGDAFALTPISLSVNGTVGGETPEAMVVFETAAGTRIALSNPAPGASTNPSFTVPLAQQLAGDRHLLMASGRRFSGNDTITRYVAQEVAAPATGSVTYGAEPSEPTVQESQSDDVSNAYTAYIPEQSDYARLFSATFTQGSGNLHRTMQLVATAAKATKTGFPTKRRLRAPVFDGAPGWDPLWEMKVNTPMWWRTEAFGWDAAGGVMAPRGEGVVTRSYMYAGPYRIP